MNWEQFGELLEHLFQPINQGDVPLKPNELWSIYGQAISPLAESDLKEEFTELQQGVWSAKPYEAARLLSQLRQRFNSGDDGRELVGRLRVETLLRRRPVRNISASSLNIRWQQSLAQIGELSDYSEFQTEGWRKVAYALKHRKSLIITAPTGAGKTEVFLLPLVATIASQLKTENPPRYILVYPRVTLIRDQVARILKYAYRAASHYTGGQLDLNRPSKPSTPIVVGLQFGGIRSKYQDTLKDTSIFLDGIFQVVPICPICKLGQLKGSDKPHRGIAVLECTNEASCGVTFHMTLSRNDHDKGNPHILVTTIESLDRLYLNPKLEDFLQHVDGIIFDEVHLYYSLYGAHVSNIINRIESFQANKQPITKVGSSATVSNPTRFAARLFHQQDSADVDLHDASHHPLEPSGVEAIIFVRSPEGEDAPPSQSTLIQTAMAVGHGILGQADRTILFTESVDHANRTTWQLKNAEQQLRLWQFRSRVANILYRGSTCPDVVPGQCSIYVDGECWRGLRGGTNCVDTTKIIEASLDPRVISSKNPNPVSEGDIVVATASLEVGVDDPNFRATIHYRSPLSIFSFIQRRGRAGRSGQSTAYTVVVLGNEASDEFYFRRRNRLMNSSNYELPLNPQNLVIQRMHQTLEFERQAIGALNKSYDLPASILIWTLRKYTECRTLGRLFGSFLNGLLINTSARQLVQEQQKSFLRWISHNQKQFRDYLNIDLLLDELVARVPSEQYQLAADLRNGVQEFRRGDEQSGSKISQYARQMKYALVDLDSDARDKNDIEEIALIDKLTTLVKDIESGHKLGGKTDANHDEISSLYQFFAHLDDKLKGEKGEKIINFAPDMVPLVLQSLFYIGTTCLNQHPECGVCPDFYVPNAYFQEVKPIIVDTITATGRNEATTEVEDSTRLASMLIPYKPFYRYFQNTNENNYMALIVTDHHPDWVSMDNQNNRIVRLRLKAEGIRQSGSLSPRRLYVRPVKSDAEGNGIVSLCSRCYRVYSEDKRQSCNCGGSVQTVRLFSQPIVERIAQVTEDIPLSRTFYYLPDMIGRTIIHGAEVRSTPSIYDPRSGRYTSRIHQRQNFRAIYHNINDQPEPLVYSIQTRGIAWDLSHLIHNLQQDSQLAEQLTTLGKILNSELILHTAAHMLYKAIATISGVSEQVLEYSFNEPNVVVWERYEGGIGLSEIVRDVLMEHPKILYKELLSSLLCPVFYSHQLANESDEQLRASIAERWSLAPEDELISTVVTEALAEYRAQVNHKAEGGGCKDGCPACIEVTMCTSRKEQEVSVSRLIAEAIMDYFRRRVTREQFYNMQDDSISRNIGAPDILRFDDQQETFDVVCF